VTIGIGRLGAARARKYKSPPAPRIFFSADAPQHFFFFFFPGCARLAPRRVRKRPFCYCHISLLWAFLHGLGICDCDGPRVRWENRRTFPLRSAPSPRAAARSNPLPSPNRPAHKRAFSRLRALPVFECTPACPLPKCFSPARPQVAHPARFAENPSTARLPRRAILFRWSAQK